MDILYPCLHKDDDDGFEGREGGGGMRRRRRTVNIAKREGDKKERKKTDCGQII